MFNVAKKIINSQLYAVSLYARTIAGTLILFVIARYLSVYDFGLFSSYKNIAVFCLMFANLGYSDYILVSSKANTNEVKLKISLFLVNAILFTIIVCIGGIFCNLESSLLFALVVVRTFFDGVFFALILPYFQATKKFNVIATINIVYAACIVIIALISYIFKLSLVKFLILNIILGTINFIQCSYYAKINYFLFFNNIKRFISMLDKSIFAYMGTVLAYYLYAQIPSLYVSIYIPKEQAALFFAAYTIANIAFIVVNAQNQKIVPELIKSTYKQSKSILKKNTLFIVSVLMVILLAFTLIGKSFLKLLYVQDVYQNANNILAVLLLGNIFIALGAVNGAYITAKGYQKLKINMMLEASIITVVSLFIFHDLGLYSAVMSFLLAAMYAGLRFTICTHNLLYKQHTEEVK